MLILTNINPLVSDTGKHCCPCIADADCVLQFYNFDYCNNSEPQKSILPQFALYSWYFCTLGISSQSYLDKKFLHSKFGCFNGITWL